ncbi:MAG TPA: LysM domain-containing protein [Gaiellaceae bacterium]|nr:LysM domain-containing protein [Gaiellaceae bacterium]
MAISVGPRDERHDRAERVFRVGARLAAVAAYTAAVAIAIALFAPLFRSDGAAVTVSPAAPPVELTTVRPGETLALVAARNGISLSRLLALNPELQPLALEPRQKLRVR